MIPLDEYELKAASVPMTVGTIALVERIIGSQPLQTLERTGQAVITIEQKLRLMTDVLGYPAREAEDAPVELLELEMTCFFFRWLERCAMARLHSEHSRLSAIQSLLERGKAASD
ncbi:MAG: hypothetical protein M5R41_10330 [Bacteroidia bacterium]|nr:hypothetical protein [Bacteroidia bacterium]